MNNKSYTNNNEIFDIMKKKHILILFFVIIGMASCSDFLNEESGDEVIVKTVADYKELLLGSGYPSPTGKLYNTLYLLDDDYMLNEKSMWDPDNDYEGAVSAFPFFTWQPDMWENQNVNKTYYDDCYAMTYERIVGVNAVLDGIEEASGGTRQDMDIVKAEALALRGYYYFMLVNIFGKPYKTDKESLGVPLKLNADMNTSGLGRNTVAEVYTQIVRDLEESSELFRKYPKTRGDFRFNIPSVNIVLCRVYLQMENWDKVIEAATTAIDNGNPITNYTLLPAKNGTMASYDYSEVELLYGNGYSTCSLPGFKVSDELIGLFDDNDMRKVLWFYNGNVYKKRLGSKRTPTNAIRISEAYLCRAEAYARKNNDDAAWKDLTKLRENRYKDYVPQRPTSNETLIKDILKERRLELCFDEVRWFDLRRNGMPSIVHFYKTKSVDEWQKYVLKDNDPMYTLPLPNEVIQENPALRQNESAAMPKRPASV